jgi:hypothetical protein
MKNQGYFSQIEEEDEPVELYENSETMILKSELLVVTNSRKSDEGQKQKIAKAKTDCDEEQCVDRAKKAKVKRKTRRFCARGTNQTHVFDESIERVIESMNNSRANC